MAKLKTITIKNKTYKYKTIPSLAKQLKKSKAQTKALVKIAKLQTIKIKNKTYKYKTIPSLAKQLKKSKAQTKALVKINTLIPKLKKRQMVFIKIKKHNLTDKQAVDLLGNYLYLSRSHDVRDC